jgi:hypothetical protein
VEKSESEESKLVEESEVSESSLGKSNTAMYNTAEETEEGGALLDAGDDGVFDGPKYSDMKVIGTGEMVVESGPQSVLVVASAVGLTVSMSDAEKVERIRMYLETALGFDDFLNCYCLMQDRLENPGVYNEVQTVLGSDKSSYLPVLEQLILLEESL